MIKSIRLLAVFMVLSIGLPVQAAMYNPGNLPVTGHVVQIGAPSNDIIGNITTSPSTDWLLNIEPEPWVEVNAAFDATGLAVIDFQLFKCEAGGGACFGTNNWEAVSGVVSSFSTLLMASKDYFVRVLGPDDRGYVVGVTATVPIPAAALLFLSGLAGFGLLSRKRNRLARTA